MKYYFKIGKSKTLRCDLCVCVFSFLQNTDQTTRWRSVRAVDQTATTPNTWTRSSAPSKVCMSCVCVWVGCTGVPVCEGVERKQVCVCVALNPGSPEALWSLRGSFKVRFHVSALVSIRLSVWDESMSSSLFVSSLWLFNILLHVCVNKHDMCMTPARVWLLIHVVFFFFFCIFLSICAFMFVCSCVCVCSLVVKPEVGSLVSALTAHSSQEKSSSRVKFRRKVERRENYCKEVRSGNDTSATMSDVSPHTATHPKRKIKSESDHSASPGCKSVNCRATGNPPFLPFRQWNLIF